MYIHATPTVSAHTFVFLTNHCSCNVMGTKQLTEESTFNPPVPHGWPYMQAPSNHTRGIHGGSWMPKAAGHGAIPRHTSLEPPAPARLVGPKAQSRPVQAVGMELVNRAMVKGRGLVLGGGSPWVSF